MLNLKLSPSINVSAIISILVYLVLIFGIITIGINVYFEFSGFIVYRYIMWGNCGVLIIGLVVAIIQAVQILIKKGKG